MSRRPLASANYVFCTEPKDGRRSRLVTWLASAVTVTIASCTVFRGQTRLVYKVSTKMLNRLRITLNFYGNDAAIKVVAALIAPTHEGMAG